MEFYEVINRRRSIRGYEKTPIPQESIDRIAEALQKAPSACNLQPWRFLYIEDPELRAQICDIYMHDWLKQAPAIIVALGNSNSCWKRLEGDPCINIDIGIAMEHVVLAATAENLATCWICAYEIEKMNEILQVKTPWSALAITPIGFSDKVSKDIIRKPISEIFEVIR